MKYTNEQIRGAILRAADRIERDPGSMNHGYCKVGDVGGIGFGCVWAHIGDGLGMSREDTAMRVAEACGIDMPQICADNALFSICRQLFVESKHNTVHYNVNNTPDIWSQFPDVAVAGLRAFADKHFPTVREKHDPAFLRFKQSFTNSLESA
jgi:hypothetical protein